MILVPSLRSSLRLTPFCNHHEVDAHLGASIMANALFTSYKVNMLGGGTRVDIDADTISAIFVDHADDTPAPATDDFMDDILAAGQVPGFASGPALASKTTTGGVFDAADTVFTALSGDQSESLVLFKNTGTDTTSDLMVFIDTATGLPLTPNGGDVTVVWDSGANKIFALN
jgi:hypothetical protein